MLQLGCRFARQKGQRIAQIVIEYLMVQDHRLDALVADEGRAERAEGKAVSGPLFHQIESGRGFQEAPGAVRRQAGAAGDLLR